MWKIWLARNGTIFQHRTPDPSSIVDEACTIDKNFKRWNPKPSKQEGRKGNSPDSWIPPKIGALKFNIDGSIVGGEKEGAVAGICCDSVGKVVAGYAKRVATTTVLEVQALALRSVLNYLEAKEESGL